MPTHWIPHDYQRRALEFVITRGSGQLWLDPGLGKTSIMLQAIKTLRSADAIRRTLVIAPLRPAYGVWPKEIAKWENFEGLTCSVLHGSDKDKKFKDNAMIHIVNFDGLQWLSSQIARKGGEFPYDMLIVDEISYLKNTRTQRFKILNNLLDKFTRRFGLTGSPAPNSLLDVFGPQLVIDRGATFGRFITHFKNKYFFPTGFGGYEWKLQPGAEDQIYSALAGKVLQMSAEDYLKMPPFVLNKVEVELPAHARKAYDELERTLVTSVLSGDVTASTAAVAMMKCHQVANGGVFIDGAEREVQHMHDAKTEAALELVEENNGHPVMIAYHFTHDLARLRSAFPKAKHIGSGVVGKELDQIIDDWNAGKIPVLLCHPQSAGHGLNMQDGGSTIIWYSNTYSMEIFDQFNRRIYRQGQPRPVMVHQIVAKDTVDEAIIGVIKRKDKTQKNLLNALKDYVQQQKVDV